MSYILSIAGAFFVYVAGYIAEDHNAMACVSGAVGGVFLAASVVSARVAA